MSHELINQIKEKLAATEPFKKIVTLIPTVKSKAKREPMVIDYQGHPATKPLLLLWTLKNEIGEKSLNKFLPELKSYLILLKEIKELHKYALSVNNLSVEDSVYLHSLNNLLEENINNALSAIGMIDLSLKHTLQNDYFPEYSSGFAYNNYGSTGLCDFYDDDDDAYSSSSSLSTLGARTVSNMMQEVGVTDLFCDEELEVTLPPKKKLCMSSGLN